MTLLPAFLILLLSFNRLYSSSNDSTLTWTLVLNVSDSTRTHIPMDFDSDQVDLTTHSQLLNCRQEPSYRSQVISQTTQGEMGKWHIILPVSQMWQCSMQTYLIKVFTWVKFVQLLWSTRSRNSSVNGKAETTTMQELKASVFIITRQNSILP